MEGPISMKWNGGGWIRLRRPIAFLALIVTLSLGPSLFSL